MIICSDHLLWPGDHVEAAGRGGQHRDQPLLQPRHAARRQRVRPLPRTPQVALLRCRQDPEGPGDNTRMFLLTNSTFDHYLRWRIMLPGRRELWRKLKDVFLSILPMILKTFPYCIIIH